MTPERFKEIESAIESSRNSGYGNGKGWCQECSIDGYAYELLDAYRELLKDRDDLRKALSDAATEINCAGPVAERIRVLKTHHGEQIERMERRLIEAELQTVKRYVTL